MLGKCEILVTTGLVSKLSPAIAADTQAEALVFLSTPPNQPPMIQASHAKRAVSPASHVNVGA